MTASYLQNNDYTPLQLRRPYQLNVNDIAQTVATLDSYWKQGAARVKAQYENVAGLDLITDENKKITSDFLKNSQEQLKKLSTRDLSSRDVQMEGINLFKPFFDPNNQQYSNVLKESQVVSHLNSEESTAESFRTKDGGKNYNPLSHENIRYQKSILSKLNTGDAWKAIANGLETYVTAPNVTQEIEQIKKAITERVKAEYEVSEDQWSIRKIEKEGIPYHVLKAGIEEMGSPALKAYMRSQGRNDFYKKVLSDPNNVDKYYQQLGNTYFDDQISDVTVQKALVERELALLDKTDKNYDNASNFYKQQISQADTVLKQVESQRENYLSTLTGLSDLRNIATNLGKIDNLSEQTSINTLARKMSYENIITNEVTVNPVKLAVETMNQKRMEFQYQMNRDAIEDEQWRLKYEQEERKIKAEGGGGESNMTGILGGDIYNQPLASNMSPASLEELGKEAIEQSFANLNNDAELTGTFLKSVLGDSGSFFKILQDNIKSGKPIREIDGAENMGITDKISEFIKHYVADKDLKYGVLNIPKGTSKENIKNLVSNLTPSQINQFLPQLLSDNREYVMKAIESFSPENGKANALQFRSVLDDADAKRLNFNSKILPEIKRELGVFGKYFEGYSEKDIQAAFDKIPQDKKIEYYKEEERSVGLLGLSKERVIKSISKEEYQKMQNSGIYQGQFSKELNYADFKEIVSPIINRTIGKQVVNNYGKQQTVTYSQKQISNNIHIKDFEQLRTTLQQAGDTDGDIRTLLDKVSSLGAFRGINIKTPNVNSKTASVDILLDAKLVDDFSKEEIAKLKNIPIASASLDPKWSSTGNNYDDRKTWGSILAMSTSNRIIQNDGAYSYIKVLNNATDASILPVIQTNIPPIKFGESQTPIGVNQILELQAKQRGFSSFSALYAEDPSEAQKAITSIMVYYEKFNK